MQAQPLLAKPERAAELKQLAGSWPSHDLSPAQVDQIELLLTGALAPLRGFVGITDLASIRGTGTLADGTPWPEPITLSVPENLAKQAAAGDRIALRDPEGVILAALTISECFEDNGAHLLAGDIEGLALPHHYDHAELRGDLDAGGGIALMTSGALHRAQFEAASKAVREHGLPLTIYAQLGTGCEPFDSVRLLRAALPHLPAGTRIRILPLSASSPDLQQIVAGNLGVKTLLGQGSPLPEGPADDTFPEIAAVLATISPPRSEQGFTVFFSGLSGSGKSTIANILRVKLSERGGRKVTLLDGDLVRKSLSSELTFSREHRNINILRIGFVAAEVTKHGGIAICAPIAPYDSIRKQVRAGITPHGGFVLVHVATPLEVCEERDRKGLYAMARAGKIKEFTGISDPYEEPDDAELVIQTTELSAEQACDRVIEYLEAEGYLPSVKS